MPKSARDLAIALILIAAGLVWLFSSLRDPENRKISGAFYTVIRPLQQAVANVRTGGKGIRQDYVDLKNARADNRKLKEELERLKSERAAVLAKETENQRLRKLLDLKVKHQFPSVVAQVIGEDAAGWYRSLFINRGSDDGVGPDMAVTTAQGVVGRVVKSAAEMSRVLLLTDPGLSIDCRVARTRDRGLLSGSLERGCVLGYISLKSTVAPGDEVITSGLDGVFPRGLTVGKVESVRKGSQDLFLEATVIPAVDFSELEEVLVVLGHKGGFDIPPGLEVSR
jgi:rod shape-determining protein MreC